MPQLYMIIPVGTDGNRPDNTLPQPPLGIWGPGFPYPDQGLPGGQGGRPTHPIYNPAYPDNTLPQPPLGIWGGVAPPYPSHPIAPGGPPLGMWGPTDPRPTPPIYIPGQPILPDPGDPTKAHIVVYVPGAGAVSFTVDLAQLPEPTPPVEATPKPSA